jgi:hypothetical protein
VKKAHEESFELETWTTPMRVVRELREHAEAGYIAGFHEGPRHIRITIRVEIVDPPAAGGEVRP